MKARDNPPVSVCVWCGNLALPPATLSSPSIHLPISHRPSSASPSIYHNIPEYAAPLIPISPPHCPRFRLFLLLQSPTMMHHTFQPLPLAPFAHLDQWSPPWPDVYAFSKSDSRLSRPHPYSSRRRPPYPRLESTSGLSPRSHRTESQPVLRTQVPPILSALPIPMATPALEREFDSF